LTLRQLEIVSNIQFLTEERIKKVIEEYDTIKEWAYILHDKDKNEDGSNKEPHYHVYLWFQSPTQSDLVAKWFELPQNFISKVKGRKKDILLYFTHKNAPTKHQYQDEELKSNFSVKEYIEKQSYFERLSNFKEYSYASHINFIYDNFTEKEKTKAYQYLKEQYLLHCEYLETKGDRSMKVIFINGEAGSGKTTFAKKICEQLKLDYYVSSSNNDALGGYKGQKVLILDDARDSTFSFNDFLKLLDNHTSSSVRSRYNNKVFNGDIIIITSVIPLFQWYSGVDSKVSQESKTQLYRRISEYYEMDKYTIKAYDRVVDTGMPNLGHEKVIPNFITALFATTPSETLSIFSKTLKMLEEDETYGPLVKAQFTDKKPKLPF